MTMILGWSGKKGSGKNTSTNYIVGMYMDALKIVRTDWAMTSEGKLWIGDLYGDESEGQGVFDISRRDYAMQGFLAQHLDPYVKVYSFADLLKMSVCMQILGLTEEQCYGTDEQKNTLTHLKWKDMPSLDSDANNFKKDFEWSHVNDGYMTAREVMQYVGSNIFRVIYNNVWVDATIRQIQADGAELALISDCRFPNEVEGIQKAGGKVIRLTRNPYPDDNHISETALDEANFNWSQFDIVLDNKHMNITAQCDETRKIVESLNLIKHN